MQNIADGVIIININIGLFILTVTVNILGARNGIYGTCIILFKGALLYYLTIVPFHDSHRMRLVHANMYLHTKLSGMLISIYVSHVKCETCNAQVRLHNKQFSERAYLNEFFILVEIFTNS